MRSTKSANLTSRNIPGNRKAADETGGGNIHGEVVLKKTLIVWRRLGREHEGEEEGIQANPPDVVAAHIHSKIDSFGETPPEEWRWWQFNEEVLVEKPFPSTAFDESTVIYYLPKRGMVVVENYNVQDEPRWRWRILFGEMNAEIKPNTWVFSDHLAYLLVEADGITHTVEGLDKTAQAHELGLLDAAQLRLTLTRMQDMVGLLREGLFPPQELRGCREAVHDLS